MLTIIPFISTACSPLSTSFGRFPVLRGGKGNNLFYSTKTFFKILKFISLTLYLSLICSNRNQYIIKKFLPNPE